METIKPSNPARREFVVGAISAMVLSTATGAGLSSSVTSLTDLGAVEAVRLMTRGELSVAQYAAALLARCSEARALNAFITLDAEQVMTDARNRDRERLAGKPMGPLFGLPMPIKDSVNILEDPEWDWFEVFKWDTRNVGQHLLYSGGVYDSYLQLPVIPPKRPLEFAQPYHRLVPGSRLKGDGAGTYR